MAAISMLATGDPRGKEPASYSRFVLPFAYELRSLTNEEAGSSGGRGSTPQVYWKEECPASVSRRHYLTFETADALYERAKWFCLTQGETSENEVQKVETFALYRPLGPVSLKKIEVTQAAPRLVLLEKKAKTRDLFSTGLLILELSFRSELSAADLCWVNETYRYWMRPFEKHPELRRYGPAMREVPGFCASSDDPYFSRWAALLAFPAEIEERNFQGLVAPPPPASAAAASPKGVENWVRTGEGESGWVVYSDPRAYVWTCAVVPAGGGALAADGSWVRLLNVDPPDWGQPSDFEKQWIDQRTYQRWAAGGSLYGFTLHSGAAALPACEEPPLWRHFGESYFDQTLLLLYSRVTLFRISRALSESSAKARDGGKNEATREQLRKDLTEIRETFTLFANLYQFPLLSNQQQGIELYALAREVMDIEELAGELARQVTGSHDLLEMRADHDEAVAARRLSVVAVIGLVPAVITGFLGMNVVSEGMAKGVPNWQGVKEWIIFLVVSVLSIVAFIAMARRWVGIERFIFGSSKVEDR